MFNIKYMFITEDRIPIDHFYSNLDGTNCLYYIVYAMLYSNIQVITQLLNQKSILASNI